MSNLFAAGFSLPPIDRIAAIAVVIFLAIGLHEYAHAKFADMAGDPTPGYYGRVTLNLTKHFELVGTIMILFTSLVGVGIGWGKPVPMDPRKMKNPRWDHFVAVLAGPVSNLVQAVVFATVYRLLLSAAPNLIVSMPLLSFFLEMGVMINLSLMIFNLLPIGPLDGMWILGTFLGDRARYAWTRWNLTVGQFMFLALVLMGQLSSVSLLSAVILPPFRALYRLLMGAA